ncbi:tetratricopeptide repeat protein [Streptomyces sp. NPDC046909]|uniref:tetratricopeptide repeat protein n=1 Tax=Streptomyces sp. NPDC046909 TaxID=3155617 RepID=UPI0033E001C5
MALLRERHLSASTIGTAGNAAAALKLLTGLEADCRTRLGDEAWFTLVVRHGVAYWTGVCGRAAQAGQLTLQLLTVYRERLDDHDHHALRLLRDDLARWTGEAGDPGDAARRYAELRRDTERALGPDAPETLLARHNTAYWSAADGARTRALADFRALLDDEYRVNGPAHPHTLAVRHNIAYWTEAEGDPRGALTLFAELLHDRVAALGREHPHTLLNAFHVARLTRHHEDASAGTAGLAELLPVFTRVFADDHPWTRRLRRELGAV